MDTTVDRVNWLMNYMTKGTPEGDGREITMQTPEQLISRYMRERLSSTNKVWPESTAETLTSSTFDNNDNGNGGFPLD